MSCQTNKPERLCSRVLTGVSLLVVVALAMSAASRVAATPALLSAFQNAHLESTPAPVTPVTRRRMVHDQPRPDLAANPAGWPSARTPAVGAAFPAGQVLVVDRLMRSELLCLPPPARTA